MSFLRVIVFLRNENVIQSLGVEPFYTSDQTDTPESHDDNINVQEVGAFKGLKLQPEFIKSGRLLGYIAKYKSISNDHNQHLDVSFFSQNKEVAISNLVLYRSLPWSTFTSFSCSLCLLSTH